MPSWTPKELFGHSKRSQASCILHLVLWTELQDLVLCVEPTVRLWRGLPTMYDYFSIIIPSSISDLVVHCWVLVGLLRSIERSLLLITTWEKLGNSDVTDDESRHYRNDHIPKAHLWMTSHDLPLFSSLTLGTPSYSQNHYILRLLNKPYQKYFDMVKTTLKCCQSLELLTQFTTVLDLLMLKIWGL